MELKIGKRIQELREEKRKRADTGAGGRSAEHFGSCSV